jgi:hypothetical protein
MSLEGMGNEGMPPGVGRICQQSQLDAQVTTLPSGALPSGLKDIWADFMKEEAQSQESAALCFPPQLPFQAQFLTSFSFGAQLCNPGAVT